MLDLILWIFGGYALCVATWVFYLAVMHLAEHRAGLLPVAKAHAYVVLGIGLVLDAVLNIGVCSILFLKYPQDVLLTGRLKRYIGDEKEAAWRRKLAGWLCRHLLDQFDPKGGHCSQ